MKTEQYIEKIRNGLWKTHHGNGVVSQHSTEDGALRALHITNGVV